MRGLPTLTFAILAGCSASEATRPPAPGTREPTTPSAPTAVSYRDVAPILARRCEGCHVEGGVGPFAVTSYAEARALHPALAAAVVSRTMPPWLPHASAANGCQSFKDSRALSDEEIETIRAWSAQGAPEGEPLSAAARASFAPPPPRRLSWVDATLDIGEDYVAQQAQGPADDWRCFVIDPKLTEDKIVVGYEFEPTVRSQVHHAAFLEGPLDTALAADAAAPGAGWPCAGGVGVPSGAILGSWASGYGATEYPAGTGIAIPKGRGLILQIHYHQHDLAKGPTPDRTRLRLQYARPGAPITSASYLGVGVADITLPPRTMDTSLATTFTPVSDTLLQGLVGHMHLLGKQLKVELVQASGTSCVMDIPRWNYRWEEMHFFEKPLLVPSGATLKLTCTWDNPGDRAVVAGLTPADEMCDLGIIATRR